MIGQKRKFPGLKLIIIIIMTTLKKKSSKPSKWRSEFYDFSLLEITLGMLLGWKLVQTWMVTFICAPLRTKVSELAADIKMKNISRSSEKIADKIEGFLHW